MRNTCELSINTKDYIERYEKILHEMIVNMTSVVFTDSISGSFIKQMIPHHRAAIEMSENLLQYTTNIPLQNIAINIISSQKKSIENMLAVYPKCQSYTNTPEELASYKKENDRILTNMFHEMETAYINNSINANFIREMIPHHMGAVLMSKNALRFPLCPGLVPLLEAIITSQERGIQEMRGLIKHITC